MPPFRPWNEPGYQWQEDPRKQGKPKKLSGIKTLPQLKKRPDDDYIPIHERPAFMQEAALQVAGFRRQDEEVPMDQSSSHDTPSEVGSSGLSMHSGSTRHTHAAMELEAVQNYPHVIDSDTPSEQNDREDKDAGYISSPETLTGDDGEEDEYTRKEASDDENKKECATSQATKMKDAEPGGGESKGRGVDG